VLKFGIKEEKKLLTGPASLEIPRYQELRLVQNPSRLGNLLRRLDLSSAINGTGKAVINSSVFLAHIADYGQLLLGEKLELCAVLGGNFHEYVSIRAFVRVSRP
jgi:hypothetical protein